MKSEKKIIGWREWVHLPALFPGDIKAKIDTGARSSSLHAFDVEVIKVNGIEQVSFKVHPEQRNTKKTVVCQSEVLEYRKIKSSNGQSELRPVILTPLELLDEQWLIEMTLTNRDEMGFRMLLGRESFRRKFLVDASNSYYGKKTKQRRK